jgi:amino acid transporter
VRPPPAPRASADCRRLPTSGGQYFWVAVLAPRSCRRFVSYLTGWLCAFTWQTCVAGCAYFAGTLTQSLIALNHPNYVPKGWHGSLLTIAFICISVLCNTFLARRLPMMESILIFIHILGIVIFIPVWVLAPRQEGGAVLTEFYNPNGWMSSGVAFMVGMTGPITALIGFDCSIHMAEEAKDSSRIVPRTLLIGYVINGVLGFFALITWSVITRRRLGSC